MEQNKGAQRAAWFAGQAVSAATNPKLFIVKVLVTILAVLIGGAFMGPVGMFVGVPVFRDDQKPFASEYVNQNILKISDR